MNTAAMPDGRPTIRPNLIPGNHYFSLPCKKCGHDEPVLDDPYNGEKAPQEVMQGGAALLAITCSACKHRDDYSFSELKNYRHPVTDQG